MSTRWRDHPGLNLWGLTEGSRFAVIVLAITAAFVYFEVRYNIDLLNTLSDPAATGDAVDALSQRGKVLASMGICWAFGRALIVRIKPVAIALVVFGACCVGFYQLLDHLYTKVIADLPPEVKVEGFNLFNYRRDILTETLSDPDIPHPRESPTMGRILMGSFPIVLLDERFMLPARDIVSRKAGDKGNQVLQAAARQWPEYSRNMGELHSGWQEYISGSRKAIQYRMFGGVDKFKRQSGGLDPNPNLSRAQFVDMLRKANHPKGDALRKFESREIGRRADGSIVLAREVPYFQDRRGYMNWFEGQARAAKAAALPTVDTVEGFQGIRDINSAVFLPPMAIITSLVSALTNAISLSIMLLGMALSLVPAIRAAATAWVNRFALPTMALAALSMALLMPAYVFPEGTALRELEVTMHKEVGLAGEVWSRLSGIQGKVLEAVGGGGR